MLFFFEDLPNDYVLLFILQICVQCLLFCIFLSIGVRSSIVKLAFFNLLRLVDKDQSG